MEKIEQIKKLRVDVKNPLIRLPATLFKNIDKRKRKIDIIVRVYSNAISVELAPLQQ